MNNPFLNELPVITTLLPSRRQILRRVAGRLLSARKSTLIVSEPWMDKDLVLSCLGSPEFSKDWYGNDNEKFIFNSLDARLFDPEFTATKFWEQALLPLKINKITSGELATTYQLCKKNKFNGFGLQELFTCLAKGNHCLVLLLSEFNLLVRHNNLYNSELFGTFHSLEHNSGLVLIATSRESLSDLHKYVLPINQGSAFFNFFDESRLPVFSKKDMELLLDSAGEQFDEKDRQYIADVSGGHPYLFQITASCMWDEKLRTRSRYGRYLLVGKAIKIQSQAFFNSNWDNWSPAMHKTIAIIALAQVPHMLSNKIWDKNLLKELFYFSFETDQLKSIGVIEEDNLGEYQIKQAAMLWWLVDKLSQVLRDDKDLKGLLQDQELIGGVLTMKEKQFLETTLSQIGNILNKGATALIEAYAKATVGTP